MKVFGSLPQELEDEALSEYDKQMDQVALPSKFLLNLSPEQKGVYQDHRDNLFWFVFGYAQAKGWTSIEKRMKLS